MSPTLIYLLQSISGLAGGALIGAGFGLIQEAARRRNEKRQAEGKLNSAWAVMPGSGRRVAYLMIVLVAIQFLCPLWFADKTQWWVSGGVVLGYGLVLYRQLRTRLSSHR